MASADHPSRSFSFCINSVPIFSLYVHDSRPHAVNPGGAVGVGARPPVKRAPALRLPPLRGYAYPRRSQGLRLQASGGNPRNAPAKASRNRAGTAPAKSRLSRQGPRLRGLPADAVSAWRPSQYGRATRPVPSPCPRRREGARGRDKPSSSKRKGGRFAPPSRCKGERASRPNTRAAGTVPEKALKNKDFFCFRP